MEEWTQLVARTSSPNSLFHSPVWFNHLRTIQPDRSVYVVAVRDSQDRLVGVVPIVDEPTELAFRIGSRNLWTSRLRAVEILGGELLVEPDRHIYDQIFAVIEAGFADREAVGISMVPTDSFLWRYLNESQTVRRRFRLYVPDGVSRSRLIAIPATFDEYLAKFSSKTRSELRRQVRRLQDRGKTLTLRRYESAGDVTGFLQAADTVVAQSWQHTCATGLLENSPYWERKLIDLANKGLLRSYVLFCNQEPCAVELGYQFRDVFHGVQTHYDQRFSTFSPGTVLLYKYLEDLIQHARPRLLSFGYGDSAYKAFFGNTYSDDASLLLFRKGVANEVKRLSHLSFRSFVTFVKRRVRPAVHDSSRS